MGLCNYSEIFGKPGEGVHAIRIFNIAIVDLVFTIAAAYILYKFYPKFNFWTYLLILLVVGVISHRLFCVRTTVDKFLFD